MYVHYYTYRAAVWIVCHFPMGPLSEGSECCWLVPGTYVE